MAVSYSGVYPDVAHRGSPSSPSDEAAICGSLFWGLNSLARLAAVNLVDRGLQKSDNVVRLNAHGGELFHRLDHDRYHFGGQIQPRRFFALSFQFVAEIHNIG